MNIRQNTIMENIQILTTYKIQNTITPVIKFNQKIYRNKTHNKHNKCGQIINDK